MVQQQVNISNQSQALILPQELLTQSQAFTIARQRERSQGLTPR